MVRKMKSYVCYHDGKIPEQGLNLQLYVTLSKTYETLKSPIRILYLSTCGYMKLQHLLVQKTHLLCETRLVVRLNM